MDGRVLLGGARRRGVARGRTIARRLDKGRHSPGGERNLLSIAQIARPVLPARPQMAGTAGAGTAGASGAR